MRAQKVYIVGLAVGLCFMTFLYLHGTSSSVPQETVVVNADTRILTDQPDHEAPHHEEPHHNAPPHDASLETGSKCTNTLGVAILPGNSEMSVCNEEIFAMREPCMVYIFGYPSAIDVMLGQTECHLYVFDFKDKFPGTKWNNNKRVTVTRKGLSSVNKDNKKAYTLGDHRDFLGHHLNIIDLVILGPAYATADIIKTVFATDALFKVKQIALMMTEENLAGKDSLILREMKQNNFQSVSGIQGQNTPENSLTAFVYLNENFYKSNEGVVKEDLSVMSIPDLDNISDNDLEDLFTRHTKRKHYTCASYLRAGLSSDGGWSICMDEPYQPVKDSCLVYSFGIRNQWSFDDGVEKELGCEVRAFDPSMKQGTHKRSKLISFYAEGLAGFTGYDSERKWNMKTLTDFTKALGDYNKTIDYIKMDIDFSEWDSFPKILSDGILKNVKQIAFEVHTLEVLKHRRNINKYDSTAEDLKSYLKVLKGFEEQGFRKWLVHSNGWGMYDSKMTGTRRTCCYELYYVNTNYKDTS